MYLSRLILNPRSLPVQRDLADCQQMHRTILSAFPEAPAGAHGARAEFGILYRLEPSSRTGAPTVLVQSQGAPDWTRLPGDYLLGTEGSLANPAVKPVSERYASLRAGMALTFRLCANPSRKIDTRTGADGRRRNGRRVELRDEGARLAWLDRKAADGGFQVRSVRATAAVPDVRSARGPKLTGFRGARGRNGARLTFGSVLFEGTLTVTDADRFRQTLADGVGPGKAYGFGLLSVAPTGS
jgi:CRISPR system Cascade subunit CasE